MSSLGCRILKCAVGRTAKSLSFNRMYGILSFQIDLNILTPNGSLRSGKNELGKCAVVSSHSPFLLLVCQRNISRTVLNQEKCETKISPLPSSLDVNTTSNNETSINLIKKDESLASKQEENLEIFDDIDYNAIIGAGADTETLNKFKLLILEVDVLRQDGCLVPKKISTSHWKELFSLPSRNQRRKMLTFLWTNEMKKLKDKEKKNIKRMEYEEKKEDFLKERESNNHIHYGFGGNTIFLRIYDSSMNQFDNYRLMRAMIHGLNVVIDCGYDENMTFIENKLCAKQLCYLFAENRLHRDPFNLHFCNFKRDTVLFNQFKNHLPPLDDPDFPINITQEHYSGLFPKEKLVYLTPHCRTEMKEFNHDDVYIIGALVDRQNNEPLSMAKAKSEGIRMAKFPLDRYLDWHLGTKSLTINQVLNILLDIKVTKDWSTALKHVPTRKLRLPGEPKVDPRQIKYRGTIFQPPPNYRESKRKWMSDQ